MTAVKKAVSKLLLRDGYFYMEEVWEIVSGYNWAVYDCVEYMKSTGEIIEFYQASNTCERMFLEPDYLEKMESSIIH